MGALELSTEELAENKEPKVLTFFSWRVSIRIINTNKRRKIRFTEVVKNIISYGQEGFSSKRNSTVERFSYNVGKSPTMIPS